MEHRVEECGWLVVKFYHAFLLFGGNEEKVCLCAARSLRKAGGSWCKRGCNLQLQTWVEKSDVRRSDASPRWPMRERVGLGR